MTSTSRWRSSKRIRPKCDCTLADERRATASTTHLANRVAISVGTTLVGLHVDISALQIRTMKTVSDTPRQSPIDVGEWKGVDKSFDGEPVRFR